MNKQAIKPALSSKEVNELLQEKYGIGLFKFAQVFAVSPVDRFVQKRNMPFTYEEIKNIKDNLKKMKRDVLKKARYIDNLFRRVGGLPYQRIPDDELAKEEGVIDLISKYVSPRENSARFFEIVQRLGKRRGPGLNKKTIIAVGWGNLISKSGHRMNWGGLTDMYYWFWGRIGQYKCYEEWTPVDGLEDYLKNQYHKYKLEGGLDQYLSKLDPVLENKDEKESLEFFEKLVLDRWTEGKIPEREVTPLRLNIFASAVLARSEGLTIFSPSGSFADPGFSFLLMFLRTVVNKDGLPEPDEVVRFAENMYTTGSEMPFEGTEIKDIIGYAAGIYLDHKADLKNLSPMIIFPDRSSFPTSF